MKIICRKKINRSQRQETVKKAAYFLTDASSVIVQNKMLCGSKRPGATNQTKKQQMMPVAGSYLFGRLLISFLSKSESPVPSVMLQTYD